MIKLEKGQIVEGEITRVMEEAVFVDVGTQRRAVVPKIDIDQLNGDSEINLEIGESIPIYVYYAPKNGENPLGSIAHVLGIPYRGTKISESQPTPWERVEEEFEIGNIVEGTVKNIKRYGAFVELPNGIDGLVHVSEMETGFTASPSQVVSPGEKVRVRIIKIEPEKKRISLSLKDT